MNPESSLCKGKSDVYAPDIIEVLREHFRPTDDFQNDKTDVATFQDVEQVIGEFRTECQPVVHQTNPEFYFFRCFYDLRGDDYWVSAFYYTYPDEILFSIRSDLRGNND